LPESDNKGSVCKGLKFSINSKEEKKAEGQLLHWDEFTRERVYCFILNWAGLCRL